MQIKTILAVGSLVTFSSLTAAAQPADPNAPTGTTPSALPAPTAQPAAGATAGTAGVGAPAAAKEAAPAGDTDHEKFVGHMAFGFLGFNSVPISTGTGSGSVSAPVVGVRYWLQERMGLDLGLGLHLDGGATTPVGGDSVDKASVFAAAVHGGVPIVFGTGKHYTMMVIPEANLGFASSTIKGTGGAKDTNLSGLNIDLGARIGSEIHFGFIGVPELSLQATVGASFRYQSTGTENDGNSGSDSSYLLQTTVQNSPWGIFTNSVSAFYYFP